MTTDASSIPKSSCVTKTERWTMLNMRQFDSAPCHKRSDMKKKFFSFLPSPPPPLSCSYPSFSS